MRKSILSLLTLAVALCGSVGSAKAQQRTLADYLGRAKELYVTGHYREAQRELAKASSAATTFSRQDPVVTSQVEYYSALCEAALGDGAESLARFVSEHPSSQFIDEALLALGLEHHEWRRWQEAVEALERVDMDKLSNTQAEDLCFALGHSHYNLAERAEAKEWLSRVAHNASPHYSHARYLLGYLAYEAEEFEEAKHIFSLLAEKSEYESIMPYYLVNIEYKMKNYRYVADRCDKVLEGIEGARRDELQRVAAESNFHLERWSEAARHLRALEERVALTREENYMAGYALYRTGEWAEAEKYLRGACGAEDSLTRNAAYHLADCLLKEGDRKGALHCFSMVPLPEGDDKMSEDARYNYCKLLVELGVANFDEEIHSLAGFLRRYPHSPHKAEIERYLIAACYTTSDLKLAYEILDEFSSSGGEICRAMQKVAYYYAVECYEQGVMAEAEEYCSHALDYMEYDEDIYARTLYLLGGVNYHMGDYKLSAANYNNYLEIGFENHSYYTMALYNMGYAKFAAGDFGEAIEVLGDFVSEHKVKDDFCADALSRMGDASAAMDNYLEAAKRYEEAAATGRKGGYYGAYRAAMMYGLAGELTERIEALERIIIKGEGPYVDRASYELGTTLMAAGMFPRAVEVLDTYIATHPKAHNRLDAMGNLALAYRNAGRNEDALATYKTIVKEAKGTIAAHNALSEVRTIYIERNDVDGFFAYAEKMGLNSDLGNAQRDSLSFLAAQRVYVAGNMSEASASFDKYIAEYPEGIYSDAALYYSADSKVSLGDSAKAREHLQRLTSMSYNKYTQRGFERLASLEASSNNWGEATDSYRKVVELAATTTSRRAALENYLSAAVNSGVSEMIVAATTYVREHPDTTPQLLRKALLEEGKAEEQRGRMEVAIGLYDKLQEDVATSEGAEAAYREIYIRFQEQNYDLAEELVYEFADKNSPQQMWLARSFLLLGDIYVARGNLFQARATYQSIVDGYTAHDDGIVLAAKERVEALVEQAEEPTTK